MTDADPRPVIDLIEAFRRSKTMFAAVELGVFDRLAEGPRAAADLAGDGDPGAMTRLLDACVALGLLGRDAGGRYSNMPVARTYLARSSPHTLAGYILYSNNALFPLWSHLEDAVREGSHRWRQAFGWEGPIFDHFFKTERAMRDFLLGMHGFGLLSSPAVAAAFDLSRFHRLVDLGGATGHLAAAARARYPNLAAAVFDLPRVAAAVREFTDRAGVEVIAGDFFSDPLPAADLYALGQILHDWTEDKIRRLLARIFEALPAGGALLIAERLLDEDKRGPLSTHMQSLNMLVCTEGRERTAAEYEALLRDAGFARVESVHTGTPRDAVLAHRSAP
jgi:acetylserotonin N-methyltransferase